MSDLLRARKKIVLAVVLAVVLVLACLGAILGFYLSRPPLLVVTDASFAALYGQKRLERATSRLSRGLFRRVIPVLVGENAGIDVVAIAVEDAHASPLAVFFPFRHFDGARFYQEEHPEVPVYVMAGANQRPREETELTFIRTDSVADLYRAGLCAALLAGENRVLFVSDGTFTETQMDAFREGLRVQGHLEDPVLGNTNFNYASRDDVGCIVLTTPAASFYEEGVPYIPVLLFSWLDPSFTPLSVKVVFDDSPWALLPEAFRSLPPPGEEIFVSSTPALLKDRIAEKADFRKLRDLLKEKREN